ncbi:MAG: YggS family pyridoxal phosphate-dependent enzyme [Blautia sp.]|nr:YggS family pyridoxal phosphate-dependent enzyme [Blautia sp.]
MVSENLREVHERIRRAAISAGRDPGEVTLIAVSKTKPVPMLLEAYEAGERVFGENKVQEILEKGPLMPADVSWHMIGHLQRNKVKGAVTWAKMIHSVDSMRLAQAISQEAVKQGKVVPVLIEVNVAGEDSKFGVAPHETIPLVQEMALLEGIEVKGLMTIAPFVEDPEENRDVFRTLKKLSSDISQEHLGNVSMDVLSMGMTNDYEVAIQEGATMVRVGTGIFGERVYGWESKDG